MTETKPTIELYTDGACSGNPGPGGWGALLRYRGREKQLMGAAPATTNNHMELTAAIEALRASITADQLQIARLKKRKLRLKDEIALLEDLAVPDIIA